VRWGGVPRGKEKRDEMRGKERRKEESSVL